MWDKNRTTLGKTTGKWGTKGTTKGNRKTVGKQWELGRSTMGNQCIGAAVRVLWSGMKERVNDLVN